MLNPAYKGQIVMSNPNSSGTGYLNISAWIQTMGEKTAWNFLDGLHENIAVYLHSGSKPCVMAATGEFPIGISFAFRGVKEKKKGAPIDIISPSEGLGWEILATGIVKGTKNLDAARKFVDWANSTDANELYNRDYAVISIPSLAKPVQYYPDPPSYRRIGSTTRRSTLLWEYRCGRCRVDLQSSRDQAHALAVSHPRHHHAAVACRATAGRKAKAKGRVSSTRQAAIVKAVSIPVHWPNMP